MFSLLFWSNRIIFTRFSNKLIELLTEMPQFSFFFAKTRIYDFLYNHILIMSLNSWDNKRPRSKFLYAVLEKWIFGNYRGFFKMNFPPFSLERYSNKNELKSVPVAWRLKIMTLPTFCSNFLFLRGFWEFKDIPLEGPLS